MAVGGSLVAAADAAADAAERGEPGQGAFDPPTVPPELLATVDAAPAACHSTSPRQQVLPLQPISDGTSRHWMPVRSTKMMAARATRSGTRGRPPFGLDGPRGNNGSTATQRSSKTRGATITPQQPEPGFVPVLNSKVLAGALRGPAAAGPDQG